jgi:hypothetical protein
VSIRRHIGGHLEEIALATLPPDIYLAEKDGCVSDDRDNMGEIQSIEVTLPYCEDSIRLGPYSPQLGSAHGHSMQSTENTPLDYRMDQKQQEHVSEHSPVTDQSFYQPRVPAPEIDYNWSELFHQAEPRQQWQRHSRAPREYSEISSVGFPSAHNNAAPMPKNLAVYHSEHASLILNPQQMFPEKQVIHNPLHDGGNDPYGLGRKNLIINDHRDPSLAARPALDFTYSGPNSTFPGELSRPVPSTGKIGLSPSMPTNHGSGAPQGHKEEVGKECQVNVEDGIEEEISTVQAGHVCYS